MYLLMQIDTDDLLKKWMAAVASDMRQTLRQERIAYTGLAASKDEVRLTLRDESAIEPALAKFKPLAGSTGGLFGLFKGAPEIDIVRDGSAIVLKPTQAGAAKHITDAVDTTIGILKMRVNPDDAKQLRLQRQGTVRISLEASGVNDAAELKKLIERDGTLSIHLVDQSMSAPQAKAGGVPPGSVLHKARAGTDGAGETYYLLYKQAIVTGADIVAAHAGFDHNNQPIVDFRFSPSGRQRFARATQENIGKPLAIVLDGEVISAPIIREPILGGAGQISGNFTVQEANDIALRLRAGTLPAKLTIIEERSFGSGSPQGPPQ